MSLIDLSRIPVHKGTNSRLGWAKYSDLYEIVYLPHTHFFMFAHGTVMRERFILMTILFYKALILQGEIWCWSLLGLKGIGPPFKKNSE